MSRQPARQHHRGPRRHAHARAARRRDAGQWRRGRRASTGSASLGDHSEVARASPSRRKRAPPSDPMPSVDELCRSYLDLKYHFDPAAASSAGLVAHDGRLGRFDAAAVREHLVGAPVGRRRGRGARGRGPAERDRPHRAAGRDPEHDLPAGARAAARCGTRSSGSTTSSRGCTRCWPRNATRAGGRAPGGARAAPSHPALPRRGARATLRRAAVGVRRIARSRMLGGGGELVVQLAAALGAEAPGLAGRAAGGRRAGARGAQALRHRAPRRDRAGRGLRTPSPIGEEQFSPPAAPRARRRGRRARALALRPAPAGGDRRPSSPRSPAELGRRPWRELVDELRNDAPTPGELLDVYRAELERARDFVAERDLVAMPDDAGGRGRRRRRSSRRWCRSPPTSRRRSYLGAAARPVLRHRARPVAAGRGARRSSAGATAGTRIPAMVAHEAYPGHHLQLVTAQGLAVRGAPAPLDADHGRGMGALLRAAHGRGGLLPRRPRRASSSW